MLNLFGVPVPDDIAAAFIAAAASKRAEESKKAYKPEHPWGKEAPDSESKAKKSAETAKKFFDAYMDQGFSREEAFELTKGNLNTKF